MAYPGKEFFDFLLKHQIYLEGVKKWYQSDAMRYLRDLAAKLRAFFNKQPVDSLGELTKAKLSGLLKKVAELTDKTLGGYGNEFLLEFRRVTRIDTMKQRGVFALLQPDTDFTGETVGLVWKKVANSPVAAFGKTVKEAAEEWIGASKEAIRKRLVQAATDNEPITDTVKGIVGEDEEFREGALRTIRNRVRAVIATSLQHAASTVTDAIGSVAYGCYQWLSVIDGKTSDTCRSRNLRIYAYGDGPRPPAHEHCRSHTIPCPCDGSKLEFPGISTWLADQDEQFLTDAFGKKLAGRIKRGLADIQEIIGPGGVLPLSTDAFEAKQLTA